MVSARSLSYLHGTERVKARSPSETPIDFGNEAHCCRLYRGLKPRAETQLRPLSSPFLIVMSNCTAKIGVGNALQPGALALSLSKLGCPSTDT
jgi:hypothetical protein